MRIIYAQQNETVEYAASELKKYVSEMSRGKIVPQICRDIRLTGCKDGIVLAGLEELSLDRSDLTDPYIEDIIDVDVHNGSGYIAGSNPRSILMGVYKYCSSAGCRFLRPGPDGDYIPQADLVQHSFRYRKKADYQFRGECCEGASSYEHMRDTVYWLPKIGMNLYMYEGYCSYGYMNRWYQHSGNGKLGPLSRAADRKMIEGYISLLEQDVKKVGLQLHTMGHGWMFQKLGLGDGSYRHQSKRLQEEDKKYLALVKGKRDLHLGEPAYTHFCYSNPEARRLLIETLVEYVQERPYVDFLHVWLADARNNQCECEQCVKMHPSDYYVMLLNELDQALEQIEARTRIVFIGYVETERPPEKLRLKHPERFVLLSAMGMHYEKGYRKVAEAPLGEIPPYKRNDWHPAPDTVRLKWHKDWKTVCGNIPNIIFEYRFYTDMYCDLGNMQIARETYRDMKDLECVGFEGCINDQTHRMYLPTSLPLLMKGETLFDKTVDFEKVTDTYFEGAFGRDWKRCREYLEQLSRLLCPSNVRIGGGNGVEEEGLGAMENRAKSWRSNPKTAAAFGQIPALLDAFRPIIAKNLALTTDPAQRLSWRYLQYHSVICGHLAEVLLAGATGDMEAAVAQYHRLEEYLWEHELEFHHGFDVMLFTRAWSMKLDLPPVE